MQSASIFTGRTTSLLPAFLSSGEITVLPEATSTAKLTSVGGTSISLKVPDMESLPPMEARPSSTCASYAPSSAAKGWLQRRGFSSSILRKYSWKVKWIFLQSPPEAAIFATESATAKAAPWKGLHLERYGSKP